MRKFVCASIFVLVAMSFVVAEEIRVTITKIEDGKTVHYTKKGKKGDEPTKGTIALSPKAKVVMGTFNKDTKKVEAGEAIADGIKADVFKADKGVPALLVTEGEGDKAVVTEIRVLKGKKKAN